MFAKSVSRIPVVIVVVLESPESLESPEVSTEVDTVESVVEVVVSVTVAFAVVFVVLE